MTTKTLIKYNAAKKYLWIKMGFKYYIFIYQENKFAIGYNIRHCNWFSYVNGGFNKKDI